MTPRRTLAPALLAVLLLGGCGGAPEEIGPTGVDGLEVPTPSPDPADFVDRIDNPWLPLVPGSEWVYESTGDEGERETVTVTVTDETRVVAGVTTTVVHDVVTDARGRVVEDTYDWFAQDTAGNVWYFGEDTTAYEGRRRRPTTEGSWEAGVDGAEAGLAMPATPRVGDGYRQEYDAGAAEDQARVLAVGETRTVAGTTYDDLVVTEDTTPLEPGLVEVKYYARGTGLVLEETVSGGEERVELVRARLVASDA
ncbi:hypothetical protein GCM10009623_28800 [Nocardioides aestuarii]|uniref:Lipoprotein n=1 Tax=Nocardioides aestuarii TaxID=252231 RepID=A0ABW4TNN9_9ACTN